MNLATAIARSAALATIALLALGAASAETAPAEPDALRADLDRALSVRALRGARLAALVVDARSGAPLYERSPDRVLVPASNLKVLTAVAALSAFGPTHRFVTQLLADAPPDPDGRVGTLYVRGGGDPALTSEDLWRMAADLKLAGLAGVRGDLVVDDSAFDRMRWHPSWGAVSARAYHAPVGAFTVNYGAFSLTVEPAAQRGGPVSARLDPEIPFLQLRNRATTGARRSRRSLHVDRTAAGGFDRVTLSGTTPAGGSAKVYPRSVSDPARYAANVLRKQLAAAGVPVEGEIRLAPVPATAAPLLAFEGRALSEVVARFLKYSNNSIGEALVKNLGARAGDGPGTWERGAAAVRAELASLGLDLSNARLVDGSGLSYENEVSPRLLVDAIRVGATSFRFGPEFLAALPIAAHDGTLEDRAEDAAHRVRAKTGLLTRVTGLSGFAERPDGRVVAFSVLTNGFRGTARSAMDALDGFVAALAGDDQERLAARP
jgi:D-alanyl-D-alanine carboxypeptidase/D-alanyl-D-alanine-endopeptidase (penicillin-binding protein 4)